jgi:carbon storage regulator
MLVLARKQDEGLTVRTEDGQEIKITILRVLPNSVRIGIEAPRACEIHRNEIWEKIDAEE